MDQENSATNKNSIVTDTNPSLQQSSNLTLQSTQNVFAASTAESNQQAPAMPQSRDAVGQQNAQNTLQIPNYIKLLTRVCLALGIITIVGTIFVAIGLISGLFFSNQGTAMMSSLLIGMLYGCICQFGTIFCIITIIMIIIAKNKYHVSITKPLLTAILSMFAIWLPLFFWYAL